ncbi:MAG: ammonium transporter [Tepidisphaeraceae bacterium]
MLKSLLSRKCLWAALIALMVLAPVAFGQTTEPATAPAEAAAYKVDLKPESDINSGNTAWMLTSSALVLMMTAPGLALFYGGLVRRKNVLATMMQSFICMGVCTVVWAIIGYSLAFSTNNPYIGGFDFLFLKGVGVAPAEYAGTIPHTNWMVFQCMFAIITPALITGAYAERMKFSGMLVFSILWLLVVYCPMAHMVWGKGGLLNWGFPAPDGPNIPSLDFAGGTVVHISSGISALVCALYLGRRVGYGKTPMPPHSVVLSTIGAALLWVGWFGFNAGSALAADGIASNAFVTTHFAAATAALGWTLAEWIKIGKPTVLGAISGAVAGLVVITPAAGFVTPMSALHHGPDRRRGLHDQCDRCEVCPQVRRQPGRLRRARCRRYPGAILTGVFASSSANGLIKTDTMNLTGILGGEGGNPGQILNQVIATAITYVFAIIGTLVLLKITDLVVGLRVSAEEEADGLDITQHGEQGYHLESESALV